VLSHFSLTGESAILSLEACREFLAAHSETFSGRTEKDVKDKARNLVVKLTKATNNVNSLLYRFTFYHNYCQVTVFY